MRPELVPIASANGGVFSRAQALACGYRQRETRMLVETGLWTVLRHGIYIDSVHMLDTEPAERAVLAIAAARLCVRQPSVGSHTSAGKAYGLPRLESDVATHLSGAQRQRRGTKKAPIHVHRAELPDTHLRTVNGVPLTTPGRTVIDLATMLPFADAVAAADAALHNVLTTPPELAALLTALGDPILAANVVSAADGASESPLESISRVVIIALGIEGPSLQQDIRDSDGRLIGRVDFLWRAHRVIGEADGLAKYTGDAAALRREKLRQEALENAGYRVVRWTYDEIVFHPQVVVARIRNAFALARL